MGSAHDHDTHNTPIFKGKTTFLTLSKKYGGTNQSSSTSQMITATDDEGFGLSEPLSYEKILTTVIVTSN